MTLDSDSAQVSRALKSAILWPVGVIFVAAILLLLVVFWLFQDMAWSDHSYEVLVQTRICENLILGTQNNVRGYLLTGNSSTVAPFDQKQVQVRSAIINLQKMVQDNPPQVSRVEALLTMENIWFDHVNGAVNQRATGTIPSLAWVQEGTDITNSLLSQFNSFTDVEEGLRQVRRDRVERMKLILGYGGGGIAILVGLTVGQTVRRQFMNLASVYRATLEVLAQRHAALVRSEADLEEQKEWFRVTMTSIGDGVIVTDRESRVVLLNHEAERMTGWTSGDALRKPLSDVFRVVHEETRAGIEDPVARVFREKIIIGLANHALLLSRTGEEFPIEDSAAPIFDAKKNILGVVMVFHDATANRRAQHILKAHALELEKKVTERTAQLQHTLTEMETFSYAVSHDLRAPLRAMQGFAQALLEDYNDKLDEQGKDYLNRISNAGQRLDRLIQDILAYSRISHPDDPLVALDLDKILRELIEQYPNLRAQAANIRIEGTLPRVMGRESALTQVLSNLLGNAVKFVEQGVAPHVRVWSEDRGSMLRLWVEDNGIGIPPQYHERIFEMFIQLNEARFQGGTGAGLSIVRKAAEAMRGSVGVESKEGVGSQFWVDLHKGST